MSGPCDFVLAGDSIDRAVSALGPQLPQLIVPRTVITGDASPEPFARSLRTNNGSASHQGRR